MNFSQALEILKEGYRVRRRGWKVPRLWLKIELLDDLNAGKIADPKILLIYYAKVNPGTTIKTYWTPTQSDILADDWEAGP